MFYSAHWKENPNDELENYRIGIATSTHPTGPFIDLTGRPLFDPGYPIIDGNVYFAEDGRLYLYYSRCCYKNPVQSEIAAWAKQQGMFDEIEESWIYGVELASDFSACNWRANIIVTSSCLRGMINNLNGKAGL